MSGDGTSAPSPRQTGRTGGGATGRPRVIQSGRDRYLDAPQVARDGPYPEATSRERQVRGRSGRRSRGEGPLPQRVRSRLAAGEKALVVTHHHWIRLVRPTAIVIAGFVVAYLSSTFSGYWAPLVTVTTLAWVGLVVWGAVQWWDHYTNYVVITQKRIMRISGIIPQVAMLPIGRVTDVGYQRGILGALLGYGRFVLESAGQIQALRELDYVPRPNHVHSVITQQLYASE